MGKRERIFDFFLQKKKAKFLKRKKLLWKKNLRAPPAQQNNRQSASLFFLLKRPGVRELRRLRPPDPRPANRHRPRSIDVELRAACVQWIAGSSARFS
jgi:hypothetical protein